MIYPVVIDSCSSGSGIPMPAINWWRVGDVAGTTQIDENAGCRSFKKIVMKTILSMTTLVKFGNLIAQWVFNKWEIEDSQSIIVELKLAHLDSLDIFLSFYLFRSSFDFRQSSMMIPKISMLLMMKNVFFGFFLLLTICKFAADCYFWSFSRPLIQIS